MEENNQRKKPIILTIILTVLAVLGGLFLILMFIPVDDEEADNPEVEEAIETAEDGSADTEVDATQNNAQNSTDIEPLSVGTDAKSATIMIYMNGSDLETQAGEATEDISEMLDSGIGDNVNVIIQTMGTKRWQDYGISSQTSQIYRVNKGRLELIKDELGQLDCTDPKTLSDFIAYGAKHYPADRYMFVFWDHGGGPVYGFGYDEWQGEEDSLTLDEMREAFEENKDVHFDIIGMDCCIMANMETCYALSPYCKYSVLSEDFESGLGWHYTNWMKEFEENPGISTPLLGKKVIDGMINSNEEDSESGGSSTMVLINENAVSGLFNAWIEYAYRNTDNLLDINYSKQHVAKGKGLISDLVELWNGDNSNVTMSDFYVSDMLAIVESVGAEDEKTDALRSALKASVAYFGHTSDKNELTGLAVSLPYGDPEYYDQLTKVYSNCGIDEDYIDWLSKFVDSEGAGNYHDYSDFENSWGGWGSYQGSIADACQTGGGSCPTVGESCPPGGGSCATGGSSYQYGGACETGSCPDNGYYDGNYGDEYNDEGYIGDNWTYDYDEGLWYQYDDGTMYLYDDESDTTYYYDENSDETYYYDEDDGGWYDTGW